jgi:hypothetical protein
MTLSQRLHKLRFIQLKKKIPLKKKTNIISKKSKRASKEKVFPWDFLTKSVGWPMRMEMGKKFR